MEIPKIGDSVKLNRDTLFVSSIIENDKGEPIVLWFSDNKDIGGCVPSLWFEWCDEDYDPHVRRGHEPKYKVYRLK